jgi:threonine/homoserine efflux transporter RhtA
MQLDAGLVSAARPHATPTLMLDRWLYLDVGVFDGLVESIAGFGYEVCAERAGPTDLSKVSLLMLTLPMFSSLLAILFLGEALSARYLVAAGLIVAGSALILTERATA